jgi:hypothetical protein
MKSIREDNPVPAPPAEEKKPKEAPVRKTDKKASPMAEPIRKPFGD